MLERFVAKFRLTAGESKVFDGDDGSMRALMRSFGGCTFENGLYRVHTEASAEAATDMVGVAFPEFRGRVTCFGFDWLGRQFALTQNSAQLGNVEVHMFEPGTGQALEIPVPFTRFHDGELVEYTEEALALGFFTDWMSTSGKTVIEFDQCLGYRVPLFLGGRDDVSNLEMSDIDVYWTIMGQLRLQAMKLPEGTSISGVHVEKE